MTFLQVLPGYQHQQILFQCDKLSRWNTLYLNFKWNKCKGFQLSIFKMYIFPLRICQFFFSFSIYKIRSQESMNWRESPVLLLQHIGYLIITQLSVVKIFSYSSLTDSLTRSWRKDESIRRVKKRRKKI